MFVADIPATLADMASTTERIADKVRGVAAERRYTQQRIGEVLGLSAPTVNARMNGRVPFTAAELYDLAAAMSVPVARFFPEPAITERAA